MSFKYLVIFLTKIIIFSIFIVNNIVCDYNGSHYTCAADNKTCDPYRRRACCHSTSECKRITDTFICQKIAQLGEVCREDSDCEKIKFIQCIDNVCHCSRNTEKINNRTCLPTLKSFCRENRDCKVDNSFCTDNRCQCTQNYVAKQNKCLPKNLDGTCDENSDCSEINFSKCFNGKCKCKLAYVATGNQCSPRVNKFCLDDLSCPVNNSKCIDHRCQCKDDHLVIDYHKCVPVAPGDRCTSFDNQKFLRKLKCSDDGIFVCDKGYTLAIGKCVPVANGFCTEDSQCEFSNFHCIDNKCQCRPNYLQISAHQCFELSRITSCTGYLDCSDPWHANCMNNKCRCTRNHVAINDVTCYPILGGYCWFKRQCITRNSDCIDFHCQCKEGFIALSDNFCVSKNSLSLGF